jgi:hypothetical protein
MVGMETITIPEPDQLRRRITDCELELKSLRRLLRMSQAMQDAQQARERREHQQGSVDGRGQKEGRR